MANEVTKTIWGGLISTSNTVDGTTTLKQHATDRLGANATITDSKDISRAAAVGVTLITAIPVTDAKISLSTEIDSSNLVSTLNTFLSLYSSIRLFAYHQNRTSWADGNFAAITPDYIRQAYKSNPVVSIGSDTAPVSTYVNIEGGDDIDLSNYKSVIAALRGIVSTNAAKNDVTINYCHSSCHSVCHSARGRR